MARTQYSDDLKARVLAELATGAAVADIAKQFGVNKATIRSWKTRADLHVATRVPRETEASIGQLLSSYLSESFTTLIAHARFVRNEAWLEKQSAGELASLHVAIADRAIRVAAALQPDPQFGPEPLALASATVDSAPAPSTADR